MWLGRWALGRAAFAASNGYTRHATSQLAAAIAYRVLFSLVPLASFIVAIADALLPDAQRDAVARWLASAVPGEARASSRPSQPGVFVSVPTRARTVPLAADGVSSAFAPSMGAPEGAPRMAVG